ncbi:MAG TPA: hypothetical protein VJJ22_00445 [Candidatus Paceibacterota bacterium]
MKMHPLAIFVLCALAMTKNVPAGPLGPVEYESHVQIQTSITSERLFKDDGADVVIYADTEVEIKVLKENGWATIALVLNRKGTRETKIFFDKIPIEEIPDSVSYFDGVVINYSYASGNQVRITLLSPEVQPQLPSVVVPARSVADFVVLKRD